MNDNHHYLLYMYPRKYRFKNYLFHLSNLINTFSYGADKPIYSKLNNEIELKTPPFYYK